MEVAHPPSGSSSTWFLVEFESGNVGYWGEGKIEVPGEKPLGVKERTNNKLNPHMASTPVSGLVWWVFIICFINEWLKRSKHGLFVFQLKKTLIWRRHCSVGQWCCSMTSKRSIDLFYRMFTGITFFHPSVRLTSQKPRAFVSLSINQSNRSYFRSFVVSVLFARFHFKVIRKSF